MQIPRRVKLALFEFARSLDDNDDDTSSSSKKNIYILLKILRFFLNEQFLSRIHLRIQLRNSAAAALQTCSMAPIEVPSAEFCAIGCGILNQAHGLSFRSTLKRYRALFGVSPHTASKLWALLLGSIPEKSNPEHLLWALMRLKTYATDAVCTALVQVDGKTFRKWSWIFIKSLSNLCLVRFVLSVLNSFNA